jgi:hypothetical protein
MLKTAHADAERAENAAADAETFASKILNQAGGDPDKALKLFDQLSSNVTDPDQKRLGPQIRKAIRARRQINKPESALDKIISGDIDGGLNDFLCLSSAVPSLGFNAYPPSDFILRAAEEDGTFPGLHIYENRTTKMARAHPGRQTVPATLFFSVATIKGARFRHTLCPSRYSTRCESA